MKKKADTIYLFTVLMLLFLFTCLMTNAQETVAGYETAESEVYCKSACDVDFDGSVTSADARAILRAAVGLDTLNESEAARADADGNGKTDSADARLALRYVVGLENGFSHVKSENITIKAPTCFSLGDSAELCALCGKLYNFGKIPVTSHLGSGWEVVEEATCEQEGMSELRCIYCDVIMETRLTAKTSHSFGETQYETAPDCFRYVNAWKVCTVCGYTEYFTEAPAGAHSYYWKTTKAATCTEDGLQIEICSHCFNESGRTQVIESYGGHNFGKSRTVKYATCTDDGLKAVTCHRCSYTVEEVIPALGHSMQEGSYKIIQEATCVDAGKAEYYCTTCGQTVEEILPALGHTPVGEATVTQPTCTTDGKQEYYCSTCGQNVSLTIPAKGHTPGDWTYEKIDGESLFVRRCKDCNEILVTRKEE